MLEYLPPREADFLDLYFFRHMRQTDIADLFQVSQPTVCYRLQRAADRIKFLLSLPAMDEDQLKKDIVVFLEDPIDAQIMLLMLKTTCQSEAAKVLGVSQGFVRHRFIRTLEKMRKIPEMDNYCMVFDKIAGNLNILREVQRPAWGPGMVYSVG